MKTLQEIRDEVAIKYGFDSWSHWHCEIQDGPGTDNIEDEYHDEVCKEYAIELAREAFSAAMDYEMKWVNEFEQDEVFHKYEDFDHWLKEFMNNKIG